jgi:hypothetical protein
MPSGLIVIFLAAVCRVACASHLVSGIGRSSSDLDVQFGFSAFSSSIESIVASTHNGPNRTNDVALPVAKLHGVNVNK